MIYCSDETLGWFLLGEYALYFFVLLSYFVLKSFGLSLIAEGGSVNANSLLFEEGICPSC